MTIKVGDRIPDVQLTLATPEGPGMLHALRKSRSDAPVIAFGEEAGAAVRQQLIDLDVAGFLLKPLSGESLHNALADCRFAADSRSLTPGTGIPASVVHKCVEVLLATTGELQQAVLGDDAMRCFALAQQIRGVAFQLGLREVVRAADATGARVAVSGAWAVPVRYATVVSYVAAGCQRHDRVSLTATRHDTSRLTSRRRS